MQSQVVVSDKLISFFHFDGKPETAPLLLLHGWRSNKEVWKGVIDRIRDLGFKIYALDLPGFGGSPAGRAAMSVGDYAEVVKGFIEKLNLGKVVLVGHSFGGRVSIKFAALHPELIEKLVLVDSAGFANNRSTKNLLAAAAKIVKPIFKLKFMQGLRRRIYKKIGAEDYVAAPELQQTYLKVAGEDLSEDMKKISVPALIIFGENDQDTPPQIGEKMHSLIFHSKFIILKNAGHFSFLDRTEEFIKELAHFINL